MEVLLDELDLGESEVIVLAREIQADLVLMDEKKGRRKLAEMGIKKVGTVGILLKAKETGLIPVIKPELTLLRQRGFSLSEYVFNRALQQAGES